MSNITYFGHLKRFILVSLSHDANSNINGTKMIKRRCDMTFSVMCFLCYQHQHYVLPMASWMAPLHLLSQANWNDMQHWHWCWHPIMQMDIKNGTTAFFKSRQLKWDATSTSWRFDAIGHWHQFYIMPKRIINVTIAFLRLRQLKWDPTWLFIIWCHQHQHWPHIMPWHCCCCYVMAPHWWCW